MADEGIPSARGPWAQSRFDPPRDGHRDYLGGALASEGLRVLLCAGANHPHPVRAPQSGPWKLISSSESKCRNCEHGQRIGNIKVGTIVSRVDLTKLLFLAAAIPRHVV